MIHHTSKKSMTMLEKLQKRQEQIESFRQQLVSEGITVKEFAKRTGINKNAFYQVINGVSKGTRGEAHKAAKAIGITFF